MVDKLTGFHFLIVDDDEVDILALKKILVELNQDVAFSIAHDGVQALNILRDGGEDGLQDEAVIVLLDLNMPRMGGHEFLTRLRGDPKLKDTIVFVLSTSIDPRDVNKSYSHHVSGYIPKDRLSPKDFGALMESYLQLNQFPQKSG